jgi:hypothetical protein
MVYKVAFMFKKLVFAGLFAFAFCSTRVSFASDSEFSATPDYSYDSYKSLDTYGVDHGMSNSSSKRNYNSSSHTFSGNIMLDRSRSRSGYSPQPSAYSPQSSGYNPKPVNSSSNYNQQHGTYTYK